VLGGPVLADFKEGLAAYDGGDYATAFEEWRPLAEAGDAEAQVALASLYLAGEGVAIDVTAGISWYRRAADSGDSIAQLNLGDFYSRGQGVARDLVTAYVWLGLAAHQGRVWAGQRRQAIIREMSPDQVSEAQTRLKGALAKLGD